MGWFPGAPDGIALTPCLAHDLLGTYRSGGELDQQHSQSSSDEDKGRKPGRLERAKDRIDRAIMAFLYIVARCALWRTCYQRRVLATEERPVIADLRTRRRLLGR